MLKLPLQPIEIISAIPSVSFYQTGCKAKSRKFTTKCCGFAYAQTDEEKTIAFGLTGTGYVDLTTYEKFHDSKMADYIPTEEDWQTSLNKSPKL